MRTRRIYVCDFCGYESDCAIDVETCEAGHIGNGLSVEQYRDWLGLKEIVSALSARVHLTKNSETEEKLDKAIAELLAFEEEHNIKEDIGKSASSEVFGDIVFPECTMGFGLR